MKIRFAVAIALLAITALTLAPAASAQEGELHRAGAFIPVIQQPVTGGTVSGMLTGIKITNITSTGNGLAASGLATVITSTGTIIGTFTGTLDPTGTTCPILHLTIGSINLNLLGLVVSVPNPIVLDITAVPGQGNLLGNLLCDVANLLNQTPTPLMQIAGLLQQILALL